MSLARCIPDLLASSAITPGQAERAARLFEEMAAQLRRTMPASAAESEASARVAQAIAFEAADKRRRTMIRIDLQQRNENWLRGGGERWGRGPRLIDPGAPLPGEGPAGPINPRAGRTLILRMEARRKAIRGEAFGMIGRLLSEHRRRIAGQLRNPARMDDVGSAAFGEEVSGPGAAEARADAEAWLAAAEYLRQRANAAGASIGKIERWGLPQRHDSRLVAEAGFERWFETRKERLALDRMTDWQTGERFTDASFREAMDVMFRRISSDGALDGAPGALGRGGIASALGEHRFFVYKDYASWQADQAEFGGVANAFDAIVGHIDGMSRVLAAMEVLDPHPENGLRWLKDMIVSDGGLYQPGAARARGKADKEAKIVQRLWDEYTGVLARPEDRTLAMGFAAYRSVATASKLGSASVTAIGDFGYRYSTRRYNALPVADLISRTAKMINPADPADRLLAAQLGFVPETWVGIAAGQNRLLGEELAHEGASRLAEGVLRVSGLNAVTDAGRAAEALSWLIHVTNERSKPFAELEPGFRSALQRYRIGPAEWEAIRATPLEEDGGVDWIKPRNIQDRELASRLAELTHSEIDYAVPVPDLETRAALNVHARRGTVIGELFRSSPLMFKTFTVAMMLRHGGRMLQTPGITGKLAYGTRLVMATTIAGAIALQLAEILKGRDPRPMNDPAFWGAAMAKGGGLGILGDLLSLTAEERHMSIEGWAVGPLVNDFSQASGALWGLGQNELHELGFDVDADERALYRLGRVTRQNLPGQNLWYTRLAFDRLIADQLQAEVDPEYSQAWRRVGRRATEQGQGLWWAPGDIAPERAPDLSNMLEGAPQ